MKKLWILGLLLLGLLGCSKSDEGNEAPAPKQASQMQVLKMALKETAQGASSRLAGGDHSGGEVTSVTSSSSGGFRTYTIITSSGYTVSYVFSNNSGYTTVSVITPGGSQDFGGSIEGISGDCLEKVLMFVEKWSNYSTLKASECQTLKNSLADVSSLLTDIRSLLNTCGASSETSELEEMVPNMEQAIKQYEQLIPLVCK